MKKPLVILADDVLPAAEYRALERDVRALGNERLVAGYQTTFWYALGTPPATRLEAAVARLITHVPASKRRRVKGVEWWLSRMRTSNVKVDFHRDRDNARFDATGEEKNPVFGSVLYLGRCRGGLLAVTEEDTNPDNPAFAPDVHDFDLVEPRPNRYALFPGHLVHGVLDANNHVPGRRLPREPELRLAIAVNYWDEQPWGVHPFAQSPHYRTLLLRPRGGLASRSDEPRTRAQPGGAPRRARAR